MSMREKEGWKMEKGKGEGDILELKGNRLRSGDAYGLVGAAHRGWGLR